ncbi:MAG: hypothetical protein R3264_10875 [Anaerolineae bacterium]|nr:hypothetical protein [Anaerolineae bacterium]
MTSHKSEPLTLEQRAYKEKTLNQLIATADRLQDKINKERRLEVAEDIREQLEEIQGHIRLLQQELTINLSGEPVADDLYRRIATALTNNKFFLARKLINKLETIEPFYPDIDRLRFEAEAGRASRRTQAISRGSDLPDKVMAPQLIGGSGGELAYLVDAEARPAEKRGLARLFEFHIVASCLVVTLIFCTMAGIGGVTALQWLIEGK